MELTSENYYSPEANKNYFSVSQYKSFAKCEAATMAQLRGEWTPPTTVALLVGSFVDAYFSGTLEQFKENHPEIFTRKNQLKSYFVKANQIIDIVTKDPIFSRFMSGDKQVMLTFELDGVPFKMAIDSFCKGICINDLKVVQNFDSLVKFRYDIQGAVYQYGVEQNGLGNLPFYLSAVTKEKVPNRDIFLIPNNILGDALAEVRENIWHFADVKNGIKEPCRCEECEYCKSTKTARIRSYADLMMGKGL